MPQLSIITINYNNLTGLKKTMQSVFAQTFLDYEYIIIDGGSTDGSKEYIEKHQDRLAYWISEKDGGIYDAMNKGILKAQGTYLLFLNSGDSLYYKKVLMDVFLDNPEEGLVYGNLYFTRYGLRKYPVQLSLSFFLKNTLPHPATFIKRTLFKQIGLYSTQYKICSDYRFFLEAVVKYQSTYKYYDITVSEFDTTGISSRESDRVVCEFAEIRKELFGNFITEFEMLYKKSFRVIALENIKEIKWVKKTGSVIRRILKAKKR